jgi:hypothetical protein
MNDHNYSEESALTNTITKSTPYVLCLGSLFIGYSTLIILLGLFDWSAVIFTFLLMALLAIMLD